MQTGSKQRVKLQRTKRFHLRDKDERVELFTLLANLLWYLVSGKSHVGYLQEYPANPLHQAVRPCGFESLTLRDIRTRRRMHCQIHRDRVHG
jgi:hypothetical protein